MMRRVTCDGGPLHGICAMLPEGQHLMEVVRHAGAPADEAARPQVMVQYGRYEAVGNEMLWMGWGAWVQPEPAV